MKYAVSLLVFIFSIINKPALANQQQVIDSLASTLLHAQTDVQKANTLYTLSEACRLYAPALAEKYARQGVELAGKTGLVQTIARSNYILGNVLLTKGKYQEALDCLKKTLALTAKEKNDTLTVLINSSIAGAYNNLSNMPEAQKYCYLAIKQADSLKYDQGISESYNNLGNIYQGQNKLDEAEKQFIHSLRVSQKIDYKINIAGVYHNLGINFYMLGKYDSALVYANKALEQNRQIENRLWESFNYNLIGVIYNITGKPKEALTNLFDALRLTQEMDEKAMKCSALANIGDTYFQLKDYANAKKYTELSIQTALQSKELINLEINYSNLSDIDTATGNWHSAYINHAISKTYHDSLVNEENTKKLLQSSMQFEYEKKETAMKAAQDKKDALATAELQKQRIIKNVTLGGLAVVLLFAFISYKRFTEKRKANLVLESTLDNLKKTQAQLVQSEKMAAFGVMASRVAHEIQNPLNFVTNFSELSEELIQEILSSDNENEKAESAKRLTVNLQKINQHSKRADSIIKQLQAHTRAGTAHEFFDEGK